MATFDPQKHVIQIKSRNEAKDYLPVQYRLVWFREENKKGIIEIEEVVVDLDREVTAEFNEYDPQQRKWVKKVKHGKGYARFRATVYSDAGGKAMGTKSENGANFPDFIEKAETGAIGRALAALGYGTQFVGFDFDEGERLADAPVMVGPVVELISEGQKRQIMQHYTRVGEVVPDELDQFTGDEAKKEIARLSKLPNKILNKAS